MIKIIPLLTNKVARLLIPTFLALGLSACSNSTIESPKVEASNSKITAIDAPTAANETKMVNSGENTLYLDLKDGRVVIKLRPDLAPKHIAQIRTLTKKGFYNGIVFHRVIDGFMAQTGDPTGTGSGGSKLPNIPAEFSPVPFKRGVVGMARTKDQNSANSQFFIMFDDGDFLNNNYTVIGEVTSGMNFVDKIKRGKGKNGLVNGPDKIVKMQLASDAS